jgi:recombination associated protein RdgC
MPVQRGTVTLARFRVERTAEAPKDHGRWLPKGLRARAFEPLDPKKPDEDRAAGFVELEDSDATAFPPGKLFVGEHALFCWRIDKVKVPSGALKSELERWSTQFANEQGRNPARSEKAQARAALRAKLSSAAIPLSRVHDVSWNLRAGTLFIWAGSRKVVEEIVLVLEEELPVRLLPLTPSARAQQEGLAEQALRPTAELLAVAEEEVLRGRA